MIEVTITPEMIKEAMEMLLAFLESLLLSRLQALFFQIGLIPKTTMFLDQMEKHLT